MTKSRSVSNNRTRTIRWAALLLSASLSPSIPAATQSTNVAVIANPVSINGGTLPTFGADLPSINFVPMSIGSVSLALLAPYDTVLLNVASFGCNINDLLPAAQADLVTFVHQGHKLIIWNSECGPQNYNWLPFPFTTNNPGALGASGTLAVVENNTLSSNVPTDPRFIDAGLVGAGTDAVGDGNVMTTFNSNWCVDMSARNANNVTGPIHTYAKTGLDQGLIIYAGFDQDFLPSSPGLNTGASYLRKIFVQEIFQPFNPSNLPCGVTVVGITLAPPTGTHPVGQTHTVTAALTDLFGAPKSDLPVTFTVTAGPNIGAAGSCNVAACKTDPTGHVSFTYTGSGGLGIDTITASFLNGSTTVTSQPVTATWTNSPPSILVSTPSITVNEGQTAANSGSYQDSDPGDTVTITASAGSILKTGTNSGGWTWSAPAVDGPQTTTVTITAKDAAGATASTSFAVNVVNIAPSVTITGPASGSLYPVGTPVTFNGSFTDPGVLDTHTAQWTFDAIGLAGTLVEATGNGTVNNTYTFNVPGVYQIKLTVTDKDSGVGTATQVNGADAFIVVYDANGGFVTGGGWINSLPGSYVPELTMTGRASFGFVSKYQKGATVPSGETEFQFKAGNLNFHSTSYQWLVIAGARAQYKGYGTINGVGNYGFLITAVDGDVNGGGGVDKFRVKIWDAASSAIVYDNKMGAPEDSDASDALGGGSIVIHSK